MRVSEATKTQQMPTCDVNVHSPTIVAHLFVCPTRPSQLVSRHHPASVALPIPCRTAVTFCDAPPTCRSSEEQSRDASTFQPSPRLEAPRHLAAGHVGHARGLSCLWPYRARTKGEGALSRPTISGLSGGEGVVRVADRGGIVRA